MNARGKNEGESIKRNATEFANKNFHKSPSYRRMKVKSHKQPELTEIDARVMSIERMGDIREILFRPYEGVDVGCYLTFDGDTYLVYDKFGSIGAGKVKVLAEKCTEKLRWKDGNGTYFDEFCVASATQLGSKANQGKNALEWNKFDVRLPLGQIFVFVERNNKTQSLRLSQRFILGSNAYEITGIDDVTSTDVDGYGFVQVTMSVSTRRESDDFKTKIADNTKPTVVEDDTSNKGTNDEGRLW